jgi:alanine racemase
VREDIYGKDKVKRRVTVEIDLKALVRNYRRIAAHCRPAKVLCVLKANAYGLGVADYAKALAKAGCTMFGVAEPFEAIELKNALSLGRGRLVPEIQILSSILPDEIPEMVRRGVILPVIDVPTAKLISAAAEKARTVAKVHFKLDTGMGRLGILAKDALAVMREVKKLPNLDCEGVFSHFPMAYDPKDPFTKRQIKLFKQIVAAAKKEGFTFKKVHISASDGINNFPETARKPFTVVRTGINLHGSFDPYGRKALKVEPVLSLKTRVAQVRELPAGTTLGYGRTWYLDKPTTVATISAGYADGLPLALTNRGFVFIGGKRCKIIGRISMDYTTVDVSSVKNVKPGDEVICFGKFGKDSITPDDWATLKGTHAYDIICSLGNRVQRIAIG